MKLYNSLTRKVENFVPAGSPTTIYVCGITPYDTTHLGHAFTYTSVDVLIRFLESQGQKIRYVQNVTDIDDDILRKAGELGTDWKQLGNDWTTHFIEDMVALNVRSPDVYPRATEVIPEIIASVQDLLETGAAYEVRGSVYFDIQKFPAYGHLSCLTRDQMLPIANERGNIPDDPKKRAPLDFVLWQAQAPGEPAWDSPWGLGRPGWHIECSSMAAKFLGLTVDIHGGGGDLEFPHHESEIAQAEAIPGRDQFVRFWFHVGMVHHEGEKMSKSLGNLVMIRDLLKSWSPNGIRLYLASYHYRQAWEHDLARLEAMKGLAGRLERALLLPGGRAASLDLADEKERFQEALLNDLDSPSAVGALQEAVEKVLGAEPALDLGPAQLELRRMAGVLGLRQDIQEPDRFVKEKWEKHLEKFRPIA